MSVFIRDVVIPDCCDNCYCSGGYGCEVTGTIMTTKEMVSKRPDWCPMVALPEKHDALIDRAVLCKDMTRFYDGEVTAKKLIYEQPVVIEAEGEP